METVFHLTVIPSFNSKLQILNYDLSVSEHGYFIKQIPNDLSVQSLKMSVHNITCSAFVIEGFLWYHIHTQYTRNLDNVLTMKYTKFLYASLQTAGFNKTASPKYSSMLDEKEKKKEKKK